MKTIDDQLKTKEISRFQLIYGEDSYMVKYYKKALVQALSAPEDEMNRTLFYGDKANPSEIADVGQILPFMADKRLIVVEESGLFAGKSSEGEEGGGSQRGKDMVTYLEGFPETTYVVFVETKVDGRSGLTKFLKKNGCVTELKPAKKAYELVDWVARYFIKNGKKIRKSTVEYILEYVGLDRQTLINEMDKIIAFVGQENVVELEDVEEICTGTITKKIFAMLDAISLQEKDKALALYRDLWEAKEPVQQTMAMIRRHYRILLRVEEGLYKGLNKGELCAYAGVRDFTLPNYTAAVKALGHEKMVHLLDGIIEAEMNYKTGKMDERVALEVFLLEALTN
ncbi:MAG: DNA polymerase III subunit delta [Eubacterium sp.]|nr:DNA polymerase III subunit delta [Eubacterium sp.]